MNKSVWIWVMGMMAVSASALAMEEPQFLGETDLRISEEVYYPSENRASIGEPQSDVAYGNYRHHTDAVQKLRIQRSSALTAGCSTSDIVSKYTWIELDADGKEVSRTAAPLNDPIELKGRAAYILRAEYSNLKVCQFAELTFLAVTAK